MLYGATLRAEHPHARILSIDTSQAKALPGVHAVLTHADVPGRNRHGLVYLDWPVLCDDKVRYLGDAVAIVAADTPEIAREALALIQVEYEPLPVVASAEQAREPGAAAGPRGVDPRRRQPAGAHQGPPRRRGTGLCRGRRDRRARIPHADLRPPVHGAGVQHRRAGRLRRRPHKADRLRRLADPLRRPGPDGGGAGPARRPGAHHRHAHRRRLWRQRGHHGPDPRRAAGPGHRPPGQDPLRPRRVAAGPSQAPRHGHPHQDRGQEGRHADRRPGRVGGRRGRLCQPVDQGAQAGHDPRHRSLRGAQCQGRLLRHVHQQPALGRLSRLWRHPVGLCRRVEHGHPGPRAGHGPL